MRALVNNDNSVFLLKKPKIKGLLCIDKEYRKLLGIYFTDYSVLKRPGNACRYFFIVSQSDDKIKCLCKIAPNCNLNREAKNLQLNDLTL